MPKLDTTPRPTLRTTTHIVFQAMLALLLLCGLPPTAAAQADSPLPRTATIVVGRVSDDPQKHHPIFQRLAQTVARELAPLGIRQGEALLARDNAEMIHLLRNGRVDWVSETLFSALLFQRETGAEIVLRSWKGGSSSYHTVFFTRQGSGIHTLADLTGKRIALEDAGSTSGFFAPLAAMRIAGLEPVPLDSPRQAVPDGKVGYVLAGGEINVLTWVIRGLADVGVVSNLDWEEEHKVSPAMKQQLAIFHTTRPIPRAVELVRRDLDPKIRAGLLQVLGNAHRNPAWQPILQALGVTRFDLISGPAQRQLQAARQLLAE